MPQREDLTGLRFGVPAELSSEAEGIEPGVAEVFDRTLGLIEELGGAVEETKLPHAPHGIAAYYVLAPAEASANLARYDGVRFGLRVGDGDVTGHQDLPFHVVAETRQLRHDLAHQLAASCLSTAADKLFPLLG